MKQELQQLIAHAITQLQNQQLLPVDLFAKIQIEHTKDPTHGDFSSNIALLLAKPAQRNPQELAELIVKNLANSTIINKIEIAGPGFINFFLAADAQQQVIREILIKGTGYGANTLGKQQRIHLEFVSANPTGPLHVGHGRGAAYGAALHSLLKTTGYAVHSEYYFNDAGRQMDILATSVWLRYLEICSEQFSFPSNGYRGDYIYDIAKQLQSQYQQQFLQPAAVVFADIPADAQADGSGDKEKHIDALIVRAQQLLGSHYRIIYETSVQHILLDIRNDLEEFGVTFDEWFCERTLFETGLFEQGLKILKEGGHIYEQEGAVWFRSTALGDEKDRVLIRSNGRPTYFASDVAYLLHKIQRGFERLILIVGADHHGYAPRFRAAWQALGGNPKAIDIPFVQFAILYRHGARVQMSTRSGSFVTLRELRHEVGNDAARFFYVMRKAEQHMDFDLDLAKSESSENPVYYVQYAHARVCSVFRQLPNKNMLFEEAIGLAHLDCLTSSYEKTLLSELLKYQETLNNAALRYEPHLLANYLRELAHAFHIYYNAEQFLVPDAKVRNARLCLIAATRQVIANGLRLLGVSAPESM